MTPLINCPSCVRSLGKVDSDGRLQANCPACHRSFGVVYGRLSGWFSNWEAMLYLNPSLPSFYKRRYEFRITTPGRDLKVLKFSTSGREDKVPVRPGDRISILYSTCGNGIEKLISINNHSVGKHYFLPLPIPSPAYLVKTRGALSAVALLGLMLSGLGTWLTPGLGAIAIFMYSKLVDTAELTTPDLQRHIPAEARLIEERSLLEQKFKLEHRRGTLRQEDLSHRDLIQRLQALRGRMLSFEPSFYATRVARVESAVRILQQRILHNRLLVDQYAQTIKMIEIELETAYLADQLPEADNFTNTILSRLDELKAIEDRNRTLWLQLEANEEVRRLSFGA